MDTEFNPSYFFITFILVKINGVLPFSWLHGVDPPSPGDNVTRTGVLFPVKLPLLKNVACALNLIQDGACVLNLTQILSWTLDLT